MKRLLLVTGSRALSDFPEAQDWAWGLLAGLIAPGDWDVVLSGGCPGSPDVWASELSGRASVVWVEYRIDGMRTGSDGKSHAWWNGAGKPRPHQRNQAMVDLLAKQQAAGWTVQTVGLLAPWSTTRGTSVTLEMARKAGLLTEDHTCPATVTAKTCSCGRGMVRRWTSWTCCCGQAELR